MGNIKVKIDKNIYNVFVYFFDINMVKNKKTCYILKKLKDTIIIRLKF